MISTSMPTPLRRGKLSLGSQQIDLSSSEEQPENTFEISTDFSLADPDFINDSPCVVCWKKESDPGNEIVLCESCGYGVHFKCWPMTRQLIESDEPWCCDACAYKNMYGEFPTCEICQKSDLIPLMRRIGKDKFVHPICYRMAPKSKWHRDSPNLSPAAISKLRSHGTCTICGQEGGITFACQAPTNPKPSLCQVPFHAICAAAKGVPFAEQESPRGFSPIVPICPEHAKYRLEKLHQMVHGSRSRRCSKKRRKKQSKSAFAENQAPHLVVPGGPLGQVMRVSRPTLPVTSLATKRPPRPGMAHPIKWAPREWRANTTSRYFSREWKVPFVSMLCIPPTVQRKRNITITMLTLATFIRVGMSFGLVRVGSARPEGTRFDAFKAEVGPPAPAADGFPPIDNEGIVGFLTQVTTFHLFFVRCGSLAHRLCPALFHIEADFDADAMPTFAVFMQHIGNQPTLPFEAFCPERPLIDVAPGPVPPTPEARLLQYVPDPVISTGRMADRLQKEELLKQFLEHEAEDAAMASQSSAPEPAPIIPTNEYMISLTRWAARTRAQLTFFNLSDDQFHPQYAPIWAPATDRLANLFVISERDFAALMAGKRKITRLRMGGTSPQLGELVSRGYQRNVAKSRQFPQLVVYGRIDLLLIFFTHSFWVKKAEMLLSDPSAPCAFFRDPVPGMPFSPRPVTVRCPLDVEYEHVLVVSSSNADTRGQEDVFQALAQELHTRYRRRLLLADIGPNMVSAGGFKKHSVLLRDRTRAPLSSREIPPVLTLQRVRAGEGLGDAPAWEPVDDKKFPQPFADALLVGRYFLSHKKTRVCCVVILAPGQKHGSCLGPFHIFAVQPTCAELLKFIGEQVGKSELH